MNHLMNHLMNRLMNRPWIVLACMVSIMCASNLVVSSLLGLGDAEALYYCYSRHLQASYLDHPPLIGFLIYLSTAALGKSVIGVRLVPIIMTAFCLLFAFLCTKEMFGIKAGAVCVLLMFASPVFSIGMTAASPDAPLAALTMLFIWQMHKVLNDGPRGFNAIGRPLLLSVVLGLAFLAKYTGACLILATLILLFQKDYRHHLSRPIFHIGAGVALLCALPVFIWNAQHDWIGVTHRLVYTQSEAGFSLRNLGALTGGQLLYVSPLVMSLFVIGIFQKSSTDANPAMRSSKRLLLTMSLSTLMPTYLLVAWSKIAEPHWPAMGYLPLFPLAAHVVVQGGNRIRRFFQWTTGFGIAVFLIAHVVVLTPLIPVFVPRSIYEPKYDLANELRGFPELAQAIQYKDKEKRPIVAAFYTQCAQLAFHLNRDDDPEVRCASKELDDFDLWYGPFTPNRKVFLFVTDNRFLHRPETVFPKGKIHSITQVPFFRGSIEVRRFDIFEIGF